MVQAGVAINVLFISGAAWCSWCTGGMGCFSSGSLLGIRVERCLLGSQPHGVKARPPCELLAMLGTLLQAGRGSGRCMKGSHHPLPLRMHWRGDFAASLAASTASASPARLVSSDSKKYLTAEKTKTLNHFLEQMIFCMRFPCLKLSHLVWPCRGRIS